MRIVTYNIHGWRTDDDRPNFTGVVDVLKRVGGDIIGLNEVYYPRIVNGTENGTENGAGKPALEALAEQLGMAFVFGPCLRWPAHDDMPADAYGNALLSRWPIAASAAHHLTSKEEDPQRLLETKEQRGLLEARIQLPNGRTFTAYSMHLDHTDEEVRAIQARIARTWLGRDRNRPHVVMGDFNAITPWDFADRPADLEALAAHRTGHNLVNRPKGPLVIAQLEKAGYVDLYRQFNPPGEKSYTKSQTPIRIDYILASVPLAPAACGCGIWTESDGISDHRPVWADFDLEALPAASGGSSSEQDNGS